MVVSKTWQHCKRSSEQLNRTQFDQLILRKIIKIVATICHIVRLKCTKFDFGGAPPKTPLGELTALHQIPSWIRGPTSKGNGGKGGQGGRGGEGKRGEGKRGEGKGRREEGKGKMGGDSPPFRNPKYATGLNRIQRRFVVTRFTSYRVED